MVASLTDPKLETMAGCSSVLVLEIYLVNKKLVPPEKSNQNCLIFKTSNNPLFVHHWQSTCWKNTLEWRTTTFEMSWRKH